MNLIYAILPVICFIAGFCFGFSLKKEDKLPEIKTPSEIIKEKKEQKKVEKVTARTEQYLENIENYPYNQKDFKE